MAKVEENQYDVRGREIVGRRFNHLLVTEYVGFARVRGRRSRCVKARCDCGTEYIYPVSMLLSCKIGRCRECASKRAGCKATATKATLCWHCAKSTNRYKCQWADGKPRTDWDAQETLTETVFGRKVKSFVVYWCPAFEEDRRGNKG